MARIRTIKPEFPQSESMGNVSRDARLLFIQMWTIADDFGRLRGNSRMLASLLFPYDDDAGAKISTWMEELIKEDCIVCYKGPDGSSYVAITKWNEHQKVDKPSKSKLPEPPPRIFANSRETLAGTREHSSGDQGPRTKDQGRDQGRDQGEEEERSPALASNLREHASFKSEWSRWTRHRLEKQKPLGEVEAESQLYELSRFGAEEAIAIVRYSIQRGALNLITNGDHKARASPQKTKSKSALEDIVLKPGDHK